MITLSKRLGHANPQITMSVYADEIEEGADHSIRRARVNARELIDRRSGRVLWVISN